MSREHDRRINEVFLELLDLPVAARRAFLDRVCGGDSEMRHELEALIGRETLHDHAPVSPAGEPSPVEGRESPTVVEPSMQTAPDTDEDLIGHRVGHIRVVEVLGRGGMGAVYKGFDDKLQRHVAIKAIHSEFRLHEESKARFLREARILSKIDHPHVCTVHDFVEGDTCDFLVMELVEGRSLRQELLTGPSAQRKMSIAKQLLEVLAVVHSEGVIHRDLKPENVMITANGQIKVLDFGLARSVEEEATVLARALKTKTDAHAGPPAPSNSVQDSVSVKTEFGLVLGTIGYMSPEQALGEPATAASDMYSLGLIFQEMFTGHPPFDRSLNPGALLYKTAEGETVPVHGLADNLTALINRMKELAPGARPSSVDALAELQRIIDRPKRIRRSIMVAVVWLALGILAAGTTVQSIRARRETRRAEQEAAAARSAAEFLAGMFDIMQPNQRGHETPGMEILDDGARRASEELGDQPLLQARLLDTMGEVYRLLGLYEKARPLSERALELRREHLGDENVEVASTATNLAELMCEMGEYGEGEALLREALATQRRLLGNEHPDVVGNLNNLAVLRYRQGDIDGAEPLFRESMEMTRRLFGDEDQDTAASINNLAFVLRAKGDLDGAEALFRESLDLHRRFRAEGHTGLAGSLNNLAWVLQQKGDLDGAEPLLREALDMQRRLLGDEHPELIVTINNMAMLLKAKGDLVAAEALLREALDMRRQLLGDEHPQVALSINNLAFLLIDKGDHSAAEPLLRDALEMRRRLLEKDHPDIAVSAGNLAMVLKAKGDFDGAEPLLREVVESRRRRLGPDHADVGSSLTTLALLLAEMGETEEAEVRYLEGLAILEKVRPPDDADLREARSNFARFLRGQGRAAEAEAIEKP